MSHQEMLVNYVRGEECRIAIVEDGKLEEFYSERASSDLHVGNIYRGRVTNVEASLQAAFIDFGLERSGFLHITDLHPRYFPGDKKEEAEAVGQKTPRRDRPPIQQCLRRGQEILVQVLKEGLGSKGPTVTSYLSIPGRFLVMMPYMEHHGVSRKVEDIEQRREMHKILDELDPPKGFGFIVRTAGLGRPKTELKRDLSFLLRLWKDMEAGMKGGRGPAELYVESDLVTRTLRDVITPEIKRIVVDDREMALRAKQFLRLAMPRSTVKVYHHAHPLPIFDAFGIERQIQTIHDRVVPLECGGSLVFDSTEAMVAIDVNSGKFRDSGDAESTAYKTNLEAVDEIARQLRLRDLGGLLVLDLIDMYQLKHRREVEKRFKENLKKDRARTKDLRISELGMLELTRQRMRPSLKKSVFSECPTCKGSGHVLSLESVMLSVMRRLGVALSVPGVFRAEVSASAEVLAELLNRRRDALASLERHTGKRVSFLVNPLAGPDAVTIACFDEKNSPVDPSRAPKLDAPPLTETDEIETDDLKELNESFEDEILEDEAEETPEVQTETGDVPSLHAGGGESGSLEQPPAGVPRTHGVPQADETGEGGGRRRRRRRRRGRGRGQGGQPPQPGAPLPPSQIPTRIDAEPSAPLPPVVSSGGYESGSDLPAYNETVEGEPQSRESGNSPQQQGDPQQQQGEGGGRRRRRRRGGRRHRRRGQGFPPGTPSQPGGELNAPPPPSLDGGGPS